MSKKKKINTMYHHIVYAMNGVGDHKQIDIQVPIYTTEHHILTELQRRGKNVSRGFLQSLKYFIWERTTLGTFVDLQQGGGITIEHTEEKEGKKEYEHC